MSYRGQRLLVAAIGVYRRSVSGRGPLASVRCTFHHVETCSAYGLRAAREADRLTAAIARIRGRLRRCGGAAVYALPDDGRGGRALGWGALHDAPVEVVVAELAAAGELPAARATVWAGRELVARWRGDVVGLIGAGVARRGLPPAQLLLRRVGPAPAWPQVAAVVALAAGALAAAAGLALALVAAALVLAAVGAGGLGGRRRRARLEHQRLAATLRVPALRPTCTDQELGSRALASAGREPSG